MKQIKQKTRLVKVLVIVAAIMFVLAFGTAVFADDLHKQQQKETQKMQMIQGAEIVVTPVKGLYNTFTGTGFILDSEEKNGQAVKLVVSKNRAFPIAILDKQGEEVMAKLKEKLGLTEESITEITKQELGNLENTDVKTNVIKDKDVWSGTLTIGYGNFQGRYFVIGRETGSI